MNIYIPTRGRSEIQRTYDNLTPTLRSKAFLVVDYKGSEAYTSKYDNVVVLPKNIKGIASIRQYIMENSKSRYIVMLDDDLVLQTKNKNTGRIVRSTAAEVTKAFSTLEKWMKKDGIAHVGMAIRTIAGRKDGSIKYDECTRMMHVLGYDTKQVLDAGCSFTKEVRKDFSMDDFHMTLQLLKKGLHNRVSMLYAVSPSASNSKGGASEWRTLDSHNKSSQQLKSNHKEYVAIKKKPDWEGMNGDRYDVVIQWKKAYLHKPK